MGGKHNRRSPLAVAAASEKEAEGECIFCPSSSPSGFSARWYCSLALADFAPPLRDFVGGREEEKGEKEWRRRGRKNGEVFPSCPSITATGCNRRTPDVDPINFRNIHLGNLCTLSDTCFKPRNSFSSRFLPRGA